MSQQDDTLTAPLVRVLLDDPTDPRHVSTRLGNAIQRVGEAHPATLIIRLHPETYKRRLASLAPAHCLLPSTLQRRLDYRCNRQHDEGTVSLSTMELASDVRCST
jgi:hypothetical protein